MKKKIIILIIILFLVTVSLYGLCTFIINFTKDTTVTKEKMKEITENYDKFSATVLDFAKNRDYFYELRANTYLEEYASNIGFWNDLITNHASDIQKVETASKVLKADCTLKFADPNVNSKCTVFKSTYEAAMNYFITDIISYNKSVDEYNEWAENNGQPKLEKGKFAIYDDYIDYDNDKEYCGEEDVKSE